MKRWLNDLDRSCEARPPASPRTGEDGLKVDLGGLLLLVLLMAVVYGLCMGFFAGFAKKGRPSCSGLRASSRCPCFSF